MSENSVWVADVSGGGPPQILRLAEHDLDAVAPLISSLAVL